MKKRTKRVLQVTVVTVGIIGIIIFGYMLKMKSEIDKMAPLETMELVDNIVSIKDNYVNMYLIKDGENYIAIDAGDKIDVIAENLEKLQINRDNVTAVFLTHSDFDHVAAVGLFQNADIYLSEQEEQMINGSTTRFVVVGNKLEAEAYQLLEDKQIVQIGNSRIQGLLVPGHTPGSMCYLVNDKYLFTGDVLSLKKGKIDRFNEMFIMDVETADKSLAKLVSLSGVEYIFTAHYGYTDDYEYAVSDWGK